jgi:hypothetical protein
MSLSIALVSPRATLGPLCALGNVPVDAMTMPMRSHIHSPAIAIPVIVPFDEMTVPPPSMGDERRLLARCPDRGLRLGRRLGHDSREGQQDEARQRDDQELHG